MFTNICKWDRVVGLKAHYSSAICTRDSDAAAVIERSQDLVLVTRALMIDRSHSRCIYWPETYRPTHVLWTWSVIRGPNFNVIISLCITIVNCSCWTFYFRQACVFYLPLVCLSVSVCLSVPVSGFTYTAHSVRSFVCLLSFFTALSAQIGFIMPQK